MSMAQQFLNPLFGGDYLNKVLSIDPGLIALWPLDERSGSVAVNAQGVADRNGAITGVTLNAGTFKDGRPMGQWDGSADVVNIYSDSLRDVFNGAEGAAAIWLQVTNAAVWSDSTLRAGFVLWVDVNNRVLVEKSAAANTMIVSRIGDGTLNQRTITMSDTGLFHIGVSWSEAADEVKAYKDGDQQGATLTGLGTWAGVLVDTRANIGARNTTPNNVWDGFEAFFGIWNNALSPAQMADLAQV